MLPSATGQLDDVGSSSRRVASFARDHKLLRHIERSCRRLEVCRIIPTSLRIPVCTKGLLVHVELYSISFGDLENVYVYKLWKIE